MITRIGTAMLYVADQEESRRFYVDLLGFEVVRDDDMGDGGRWLEVRPPGGSTTIALHDAARDGRAVGEGAHLTFACDDLDATVAELRARGAAVSDPVRQPWGAFAFVDGPDGHHVQIHVK